MEIILDSRVYGLLEQVRYAEENVLNALHRITKEAYDAKYGTGQGAISFDEMITALKEPEEGSLSVIKRLVDAHYESLYPAEPHESPLEFQAPVVGEGIDDALTRSGVVRKH